MNKQQLIQQNAFSTLNPQNYTAYDRGDMFVPASYVSAPLNVAAVATPVLGLLNVHSVPVSYTSNRKSFIGGPIGLPTPASGVNPGGY